MLCQTIYRMIMKQNRRRNIPIPFCTQKNYSQLLITIFEIESRSIPRHNPNRDNTDTNVPRHIPNQENGSKIGIFPSDKNLTDFEFSLQNYRYFLMVLVPRGEGRRRERERYNTDQCHFLFLSLLLCLCLSFSVSVSLFVLHLYCVFVLFVLHSAVQRSAVYLVCAQYIDCKLFLAPFKFKFKIKIST